MVGLLTNGPYESRDYYSSVFLLTLFAPRLKAVARSIGYYAKDQDTWRVLDLIVRKANEQPNSDTPLSRRSNDSNWFVGRYVDSEKAGNWNL